MLFFYTGCCIVYLLNDIRKLLNRSGSISVQIISKEDAQIESFLKTLNNSDVQVIGPELIFGRIYDSIGFYYIYRMLKTSAIVGNHMFQLIISPGGTIDNSPAIYGGE